MGVLGIAFAVFLALVAMRAASGMLRILFVAGLVGLITAVVFGGTVLIGRAIALAGVGDAGFIIAFVGAIAAGAGLIFRFGAMQGAIATLTVIAVLAALCTAIMPA